MGHPLTSLTWMVNWLRERGLGLSAGQYVSTGTCTGHFFFCPGRQARRQLRRNRYGIGHIRLRSRIRPAQRFRFTRKYLPKKIEVRAHHVVEHHKCKRVHCLFGMLNISVVL